MNKSIISFLSLFLAVLIVNPQVLVAAQCYNETITLDEDKTISDLYQDVEEQCTGEETSTVTCMSNYSLVNTTAYENACVVKGGQLITYDYWANCTSDGLTSNNGYVNDPQCFGKNCKNNKEGVEEFWLTYFVANDNTENCTVDVLKVGSNAFARGSWPYLYVLFVGVAFLNVL